MNFVQQQFQPNPFTKQTTYNNNNSASVAATLVQIKSVENSPTSKTISAVTFNSPESPMTKLGGNSFTNAARAQLWTLALYNNKNSSFLMRDDKDINFVALDLPNQNVLKNDCNRTRVNTFSPNLRTSLEKLLTCYCKRENITYKQGLHELAAPFILFLESGISLSETYNLFALFIDKFVPSFYNDQDFLSLQCCQKALSLLLKYHDPALYTFLTTNYLTPEIFSTPWFLTLFASKLELNIVYLLWDLYLVEQDPYFIFFLALGLLIENKHIIMSSSIAVVPEILTNLTIESRDQLKQIYKRAKTLKLNTLQSFVRKLEELEIFRRGYPNDKTYKAKIHQSLDYLERLAHVVLSPYELLQALYPVEIDCANPNCSNLPNGSKKDKIDSTPGRKDSSQNLEVSDRRDPFGRFEPDGSFLCTNCVTRSSSSSRFILEKSMGHLSDILKEKGTYQIQDGNQTYHINFVIMDLRASKESGYLPRSHLIDPSRLKPGAINQLIDEFARLRGVCHFILMTSKFDSSSFSLKPEDRQQPDQNNVSGENSLAAQFLAALTKKGFPYLSIVEGGFHKVNQILNKRNIELLRSTSWTPKSIFKVDSLANTEPFYTSGSPKGTTSQLDFRATYNDLPSANSNHSRGYDFPTEHTTSPTNSLNRPKTPNPSSGIFSSARQEVQEPMIDPQQRSKSTLKNQRKIEQPLSSKIDFHTPKTDQFQSKLGFSNHSEVVIQTRASTEASPEKFRLKATVSTPAFLVNQGLISTVRTISSPGPVQGGFGSPKISKEAMGYEENPIRASREIFSQQKNKMASTRENYHHESSGSGMDGERSPLSLDNNQNTKSFRSAIASPAYNTPSQNSPVHHNSQREQMKMMPQGGQGPQQAPISDFSSMVRYQSSLAFSTNFAGLGSGKVQINNFERDQDFTKSAYAHKEVNSIGDYMNDRKYFASSNDGRLGSDRDIKYSGQQDYKASTFSNRRSNDDDLTPEQRPSPLLREYKSYERLEDAERKNNSTPNKRSQKSMTITPQMPQKANMVNTTNKSMSGRVQASNQSDNKHFYGVGSTERAIIMANEMLRKKSELTPSSAGSGKSDKDREKAKKRDSEAGFSPTKGHYFNPEYQSQYQNGSTSVSESYLASQQRSNSSSRRPMINSGSLSAKTLAVTSPRTMLPDDEYHFYNYFQKRSFSLYICEYFQRIGEEEKNNGAGEDSSPEKSILVISQELVITVQFNQNVLQKLILIQKGVPASQLVQSPQKNGFNPSLLASQIQRDLAILSVLPLKLLLKVTSKKADPKFISIYFKFPKQEEECFRRYYEMFDQSSMTLEEIFRTAENKEFEYILDEVRTHKDDKKFTEIKSVYRLENEETAQKCIIRVKEAYKRGPGGF